MPPLVLMNSADIIEIFQSECSLYLQGKLWCPVRLKSMLCKFKKTSWSFCDKVWLLNIFPLRLYVQVSTALKAKGK